MRSCVVAGHYGLACTGASMPTLLPRSAQVEQRTDVTQRLEAPHEIQRLALERAELATMERIHRIEHAFARMAVPVGVDVIAVRANRRHQFGRTGQCAID